MLDERILQPALSKGPVPDVRYRDDILVYSMFSFSGMQLVSILF